jgi:hypothetical protein
MSVKSIRCPYRFAIPNEAYHYCIEDRCLAFERRSPNPNTCQNFKPYCHALKRFLEEEN